MNEPIINTLVGDFLGQLSRALPNSCDPDKHPRRRENPRICKSCDDARDELQERIADGDIEAVAEAAKVYVLRLYAVHDRIAVMVRDTADELVRRRMDGALELNEIYMLVDELESVFAEVLTEEERGIPTDDETRDMVREALGAKTNEEAAAMIRAEIERRRIEPVDLCECGHTLALHGERQCYGVNCKCKQFRLEAKR